MLMQRDQPFLMGVQHLLILIVNAKALPPPYPPMASPRLRLTKAKGSESNQKGSESNNSFLGTAGTFR
uniref:RxLR effector candidate protein n=1 Tax=Hyaloperonospora arabidopsidis (strain Emoy2) TaxID=559515 RepID=M4BLK9_HYAAE